MSPPFIGIGAVEVGVTGVQPQPIRNCHVFLLKKFAYAQKMSEITGSSIGFLPFLFTLFYKIFVPQSYNRLYSTDNFLASTERLLFLSNLKSNWKLHNPSSKKYIWMQIN